ncbi:alcohol dehydrogenase-like regulatory protein ErcA [Pseudodesulfovibrio pelocollis]|uniref:alcohol dehydrogenase-like regulatory protein ErcA n=1 Tax=Pseudodesulfovibrio pelocollis TaxID=3051432 RepID=UPI00255AF556|nr:alcohol dehydrogenase-like regulatory protein ErcA [Pseudodesulfovibrio sp. SB368]
MSDNLAELRKFVAPEFVFGDGAGALAGQFAANLSVNKALIVSDPGVDRLGLPSRMADSLRAEGVACAVFADVSANPRDHEIMAGADVYRREKCDAIVAVGGGSPMDCAKAIGIVCTNDRHVLDFEGVDKVERPGPPLICIPTTAGTAADISQFCIVNDTGRRVKIAIVSKTMIPDVALIDPALTVTMDKHLTAHTGLDALTHAVEAYVSNASSAFTDLNALEAVRLVRRHLLRAIEAPDDMAARTGMMLASTYAGLAFSNAILGAVHAMAHSLGGLLDLPHGLCNAILLDHVADFNLAAAPERYRQLGNALGADIPAGADEQRIRQSTLGAIRELKRAAGVTQTLCDLGMTSEALPLLAQNALADACMLTNPRQPTADEVVAIYEKAC